MVRRIARTLIAKGAVDDPVQPGPIDFAAHAQVTQADAEDGIVLLKNQGVLPLGQQGQAHRRDRRPRRRGRADGRRLGASVRAGRQRGAGARSQGLAGSRGVRALLAARGAAQRSCRGAAITWSIRDRSRSAAAAAARGRRRDRLRRRSGPPSRWTFPLTLPDEQDRWSTRLRAPTSARWSCSKPAVRC